MAKNDKMDLEMKLLLDPPSSSGCDDVTKLLDKSTSQDLKAIIKAIILESRTDSRLNISLIPAMPRLQRQLGLNSVKREASVYEREGDQFAYQEMPRNACDNYFVSLFEYEVVGDKESAERVRDKLAKNYVESYDPTKRPSKIWTRIHDAIFSVRLLDLARDYNPKEIFDRYFGKNHRAHDTLDVALSSYRVVAIAELVKKDR